MSLQAELEAGLAAPGAVLGGGAEPVQEVGLVLRPAVQAAGGVRLFCPPPQVISASVWQVVEGGALLVPQREAGRRTGGEDAGPPGQGGALTALPPQADPPSGLQTLRAAGPGAPRPRRPRGPGRGGQDTHHLHGGDGEGGQSQGEAEAECLGMWLLVLSSHYLLYSIMNKYV